MTWFRCAVLGVLASAAVAQADCPNVEVALEGSGFTDVIAKRVRSATFAIELDRAKQCVEADHFRVLFSWPDSGTIAVSATTKRNGTEREFRRVVEPSQVPADGLALTLAAVAAELLTELDRAREAQEAPPMAEPPVPLHSGFLTARAAGEAWSHGTTQGGADLALRWLPASRLGIEVSFGGRAALAVNATAGIVRSSEALGGLSLLPILVRTERFTLAVEAGATVGGVWFSATPHDGFSATAQSGWALNGRFGLEAALHFAHGMIAIRGGLDAPFHGVTATDSGTELVGIAGPGGYLSLGGGFAW